VDRLPARFPPLAPSPPPAGGRVVRRCRPGSFLRAAARPVGPVATRRFHTRAAKRLGRAACFFEPRRAFSSPAAIQFLVQMVQQCSCVFRVRAHIEQYHQRGRLIFLRHKRQGQLTLGQTHQLRKIQADSLLRVVDHCGQFLAQPRNQRRKAGIGTHPPQRGISETAAQLRQIARIEQHHRAVRQQLQGPHTLSPGRGGGADEKRLGVFHGRVPLQRLVLKAREDVFPAARRPPVELWTNALLGCAAD